MEPFWTTAAGLYRADAFPSSNQQHQSIEMKLQQTINKTMNYLLTTIFGYPILHLSQDICLASNLPSKHKL